MGKSLEICFENTEKANHIILQEDLARGQRVLEYSVEGSSQGKWSELSRGSSIGNKKIDYFPTKPVDKVRVTFIKYKYTPEIENFAVYNISSDIESGEGGRISHVIGNWQAGTYSDEWEQVSFDLTPFFNDVGQYEIYYSPVARDLNCKGQTGLEFSNWQLEMYGRFAPESIRMIENDRLLLTRSQQKQDEYPTILQMKIRSKPRRSAGDIIIQRHTY